MPTYFFQINVKPTAGTPKAADIAGGLAHVWVIAQSPEEAQAKAFFYLVDYAWIVGSIEFSRPMPDELIPELDIRDIKLHAEALQKGIAADFSVWPKDKRHPDTPVEIRRMGPPLTGGTG